jgi:hypothetical protein
MTIVMMTETGISTVKYTSTIVEKSRCKGRLIAHRQPAVDEKSRCR